MQTKWLFKLVEYYLNIICILFFVIYKTDLVSDVKCINFKILGHKEKILLRRKIFMSIYFMMLMY